MCFSAQASIVAGIVLVSIGIAALRHMKDRQYVYLKLIPIFFGIQQFFEALVWITGDHPHLPLLSFGKYGFLLFAFIVWPLWIPWSVLYAERDLQRKKMLYSVLFVGALTSVYLAWKMLFFPVTVSLSCNHVQYILGGKVQGWFPFLGYMIATVAPFFIARHRILHYMGVAVVVSIIVSAYFYTVFFTSVWCFFSALLSGIIYKIHEN